MRAQHVRVYVRASWRTKRHTERAMVEKCKWRTYICTASVWKRVRLCSAVQVSGRIHVCIRFRFEKFTRKYVNGCWFFFRGCCLCYALNIANSAVILFRNFLIHLLLSPSPVIKHICSMLHKLHKSASNEFWSESLRSSQEEVNWYSAADDSEKRMTGSRRMWVWFQRFIAAHSIDKGDIIF